MSKKLPRRPGSVILSEKGTTFHLEVDGLWHSTSGNGYAMTETVPDGWAILWDAADLDDERVVRAVYS